MWVRPWAIGHWLVKPIAILAGAGSTLCSNSAKESKKSVIELSDFHVPMAMTLKPIWQFFSNIADAAAIARADDAPR